MRTWGDIQMQTLNQMLTIAGGVIIAGAIGLVFSFGWGLTTVSDRSTGIAVGCSARAEGVGG